MLAWRLIRKQTYQNIETIVVDNNSSVATKEIAEKYTGKVFNHGPERSAQRNLGAQRSKGEYLLFIDSDMELSRDVIKDCVDRTMSNSEIKGLVIPEASFGEGFWAQCKKLERSFYVGIDWMEAARYFDRKTFLQTGGYDLGMISGEDWDLSQRVAQRGELGRIESFIYHNEGKLKLVKSLSKKFYYAKKFGAYKKVAGGRKFEEPN